MVIETPQETLRRSPTARSEPTHLVRSSEWPIALCGTDISDQPEMAGDTWCVVCIDLAVG